MQHSSLRTIAGNSAFVGEAHDLRDRLARVLHIIDQAPLPDEARPIPPSADHRSTLVRVRAILKARRARDRLFAGGLFADPAWDMLLELYAAELCGYRVSISSLCTAAAVPTTTALRWTKCLEEKGLARRSPDPLDGRRVFISLSGEGLAAMGELMKTVPHTITLM